MWCGVHLLLASTRRTPIVVALALLLSFSVVLAWLLISEVRVGCGCLGVSTGLEPSQEQATGLVRNAAMIWILAWRLRSLSPPTVLGASIASMPAPPGGSKPTGFTILEILIVIAVISVLLSLALAPMLGSRRTGKWVRSYAAHRQLLTAVGAYSADFSEGLPYMGVPGQPESPVTINGVTLTSERYFPAHGRLWASIVYPHYFTNFEMLGEQPTEAEFPTPVGPGSPVIRTRYHMAHAAFASPLYYSGRQLEPVPDPFHFRGTRLSEATFPSSKGLLIDVALGFLEPDDKTDDLGRAVSVGRADGSAGSVDWPTDYARANTVYRPYLTGMPEWPVHTTRDGLAGRDFFAP